jgi:hypothetical protein
MKKAEALKPALASIGIILGLLLTACSSPGSSAACAYPGTPSRELLRDRLEHLEIVDAETGEVAAYDAQGNPVLEGGQPLALWAEFNTPTKVEICVIESDGTLQPVHQSEVTFSDTVQMQPLGRYDIGSYLLYIAVDSNLAETIRFNVR